MPQQRFPVYPRKSHPNGQQARIKLDGRQLYLGRHGSPESLNRYELLRMEWLKGKSVDPATLTLDELAIKFLEHARGYYLKNGVETDEVACIRAALRYVVRMFGPSLAREFGPLRLKEVRQEMVAAGLARSTVNSQTGRIRRMFAWATENELLPASVYHALQAVRGLCEGRSEAREPEPIQPAPVASVEAIRPHVSRQVWAMVQLQLVTAARPGEIVSMRGCDLDTTGPVWEYWPASHKTEHRNKSRLILLGPKAQDLLLDFLTADASAHVFSPAKAEEERNAARRQARQSPMTPSQAGRVPRANRGRRPGTRYSVDSYRRCIARACALAGVPAWKPNQLRHSAGTSLRRSYGLEMSRIMLGHSGIDTTLIYAEADLQKAREIATEVG
jgi:integrase